jgi:hypothetical protein
MHFSSLTTKNRGSVLYAGKQPSNICISKNFAMAHGGHKAKFQTDHRSHDIGAFVEVSMIHVSHS